MPAAPTASASPLPAALPPAASQQTAPGFAAGEAAAAAAGSGSGSGVEAGAGAAALPLPLHVPAGQQEGQEQAGLPPRRSPAAERERRGSGESAPRRPGRDGSRGRSEWDSHRDRDRGRYSEGPPVAHLAEIRRDVPQSRRTSAHFGATGHDDRRGRDRV